MLGLNSWVQGSQLSVPMTEWPYGVYICLEILGIKSETYILGLSTTCMNVLQTFWDDVRAEMVDEKGLDPVAADKIGHYVKFSGM